jgi:hypothetical protein
MKCLPVLVLVLIARVVAGVSAIGKQLLGRIAAEHLLLANIAITAFPKHHGGCISAESQNPQNPQNPTVTVEVYPPASGSEPSITCSHVSLVPSNGLPRLLAVSR